MTLLGVFSGPDMAHTYPNGDKCSIVDVVFLCDDFSGEMRPQAEEVSELRWFSPEELPKEITPTCRPALEMWRAKRLQAP